jgi:hypothetical protein
MAFPRLTTFWKDLSGQGGSETMYCGTAVTDLVTAQSNAAIYLSFRSKLIQRGLQITYARVSMDDVTGDSLLVEVPQPFSGGYYNIDLKGDTGVSDLSYSTLLIRMMSGSLYRKNFYMSGIPDSITEMIAPQILTVDTFTSNGAAVAWNKAYTNYAQELVSGRWGIKSLSKDPTTAPVKVVTSFNGLASLVACANHGFAINDTIRISGCKASNANPGPLNGVWTVATVPDANDFTIKGWDETLLFNIKNKGTARKQVFSIQNITDVLQRKMTEHKRGIPFGLSRGRARNRKVK